MSYFDEIIELHESINKLCKNITCIHATKPIEYDCIGISCVKFDECNAVITNRSIMKNKLLKLSIKYL